MADLEKTIRVIFSGVDKDLKASITSVAGKIEDFNSVVNKISNPLAKATDSILKVDTALTALVMGGIALAIKESSSFNEQFGLISTSVDATGADLARYRDEILQYSTTSTKSISDINSALYTAAQAGIKWGDSLDFMSKAEQLAVANNANLNTTVDLLTGTMNAYGFTIKDISHINDVFFTSTLIGKQTINELGQSMGNVIGIAANFGVSFEQLQAAISTLTAKGMETSEAITAVKGVITSIVNPSKEAAEAAKAMGLDFSVSAMKANDLQGMLFKVMEATGGDADKMKILFGEVRALNGVMQMTGDSMVAFNDGLKKINENVGIAEQKYKLMVDTFNAQSQMLINTAKGTLVEIGSKLEPISAQLMSSLGGIFAGLSTAFKQGAFDPLFDYLAEAGNDLAEKLKIIAANLPEAMKGLDFSGLIQSLGGLGESLKGAFTAIFGEADLTTVEGLHEVIQKIINGFTQLISVTTGIIDGMRPLFKLIGEGIDQIASMDSKTLNLVGTILGAGKALNVLSEHFGILTGALGVLATKAIVDAVSGIASLGKTAIDALPRIKDLIAGLGGLGSLGAVGAAAGVGYVTGSLLNQIPAVQKAAQGILGLLDVNRDYFGALPGGAKAQEEVNAKFEAAQKKAKELATAINEVPKNNKMAWQFDGAEKIKQAIIDIGKEVVKTGEKIEESLPEEKRVVIGYIEDENGRIEITESLSEFSKPVEKKVDVKIDDLNVKEKSQAIQSMIEWKAKLDIANVEAGVEKTKTMFASLNEFFKSSGDVIQSALGVFSNATSNWDKSKIFDIIGEEQKNRKELLQTQKDLIKAETDLAKAKADAIRSGKDIAMKIQADGLEPELEAFMWKIVQKVQVRANEASAEFLLGMGSGT